MGMSNIIIRTATIKDAKQILDLEYEVISEGKYFISVPDELEKPALRKQKEWIQSILENEKETLMVAELNLEVLGWIVFQSNNKKRLSHMGTITMLVGEGHRGKGIGKMLLKALLAWAENNPFIEKVSLGVFSTNERAISLYRSMGFIEEGRKVKEFKLSDNEYADDVLMYKLVKE
ncbi:N-acetyltransferase [Bacillus sp. FJAT-49736]|uniref:GNAT family N-acetyltransferase n=1 Tax=Bacillus sp. FJAT-49736 TaxID=2833582 RepID=UPI001BC9E1D2|nr:N-acetyltransferase [Bacillus sp. FJAT-49736]MBS4174348.1 GNAT family N-acetyltransferase [Bacillus sp. FJAT-49736]